MEIEEKYTLFVDESGQSGIKKIQTEDEGGASPYMVLGAALIKNEHLKRITDGMGKIANALGKPDIHCNKLSHTQKVFVTRNVARAPATFFGVISKKETLGGYKDDIDGSHTMYYNKCSQYLLEKVGKYIELNGLKGAQIDIVFEEGGYDYNKLRNLIRMCIKNPIHSETKYLSHINPNKIISKEKAEEPLLQVADIVAHSLFKCTDKSAANFKIPEARYIAEIRSKFFCDPTGTRIEGFGLKVIHSYKELGLDEDVMRVIEP